MRVTNALGVGLLFTLANVNTAAANDEEDVRFLSIRGSGVGTIGIASQGERVATTSSDSASYSAFRARRWGTGPGFELAFESASRRSAFGGMWALTWLRGTTTITSGDPRAEVSGRTKLINVAATADWRLGESSPFHAGGAFGLGGVADWGAGHSGSSLYLTESLWLGASWELAGIGMTIGPRVRLDGGLAFDGQLGAASLLIDATYGLR